MEYFSLKDFNKFGNVINDCMEITTSFDICVKKCTKTECMIISVLSSYIGKESPVISFELIVEGQGQLYLSHKYVIGKCEEKTRNEWRIPPMFIKDIETVIHFEIPTGTVLCLFDISNRYDNVIRQDEPALKYNAHLGFFGIAPENTMPAFRLAAQCGFDTCIVVPKVTKDGIFVCIHDDSINRTARDKNGEKPQIPLKVSEMTYNDLLEWDFGVHKHQIYTGTKIPLLEDFFALCEKTGMKPMFSTHPALTMEEWQSVKKMLIKYNLLKDFQVKSFDAEVLITAYSVFGTEINGYTLDSMEWNEDLIPKIKELKIDTTRTRAGIEIKLSCYTPEIAKAIEEAGLFSAAICCWGRKNSENYKYIIACGVKEFTEDYHCSFDLNW